MVDDDTDEQVYERRLAVAIAEMAAAGIRPSHAWPIFHQALRRFGRRPRPPHYASFAVNASFYGLIFGVIFTVIEFAWGDGHSLAGAVKLFVFAGTPFGLGMAWALHGQARRASLSAWEVLSTE